MPVDSHPYCPLVSPMTPVSVTTRCPLQCPLTIHLQLLLPQGRSELTLSLVTATQCPPLIGCSDHSRDSSVLSRLSPVSLSSFSVSLCPGSWWVSTPPLLNSLRGSETSVTAVSQCCLQQTLQHADLQQCGAGHGSGLCQY